MRRRAWPVTAVGAGQLVLGGLYVVWGVYLLIAGAQLVSGLLQARDDAASLAGAEGKQVREGANVVASGLAGMVATVVAIAAGCSMLQGLPLLLAGAGVLARRRWGRVLALVLAALGGLEGVACLFNAGRSAGVLAAGLVLLAYAVLTWVVLLSRRAAVEFGLWPVPTPAPAPIPLAHEPAPPVSTPAEAVPAIPPPAPVANPLVARPAPLWLGLAGLALGLIALAGVAYTLARPPVAEPARPVDGQAQPRKESPGPKDEKPPPHDRHFLLPGDKPAPKPTDALAIAVLPLETKPLPVALKKSKPGSGGGTYAAGLHKLLERHLAVQLGLKVLPGAAALGKTARQPGARLVLRGAVEFSADHKVATTLELVDAHTGDLVWSEVFRETAFYEWPAAQFAPLQKKLLKELSERWPLRLLRGQRGLTHVAVLPYVPLQDDGNSNKYISTLNMTAEGVTRNLAIALSRDRRLTVVPPGAITRVKAVPTEAGPEAAWSEGRRTGKRLGVDAVFEVTGRLVWRAGGGYVWILHAELLEVESGTVLLTEASEAPAANTQAMGWPEALPPTLAVRVPPAVLGR